MAEDSTADLELAEERAQFSDAVVAVRALVGRGPEHQLIGSAIAIGVEAALEDAAKNPADYGLRKSLSTEERDALEGPLSEAVAANDRMESIVDAREAALTATDPKHQRVMIHMGREFTYSTETQSLRYLDAAHSERVAPVHVRTDPEADLEHEQMLERDRERGRGM